MFLPPDYNSIWLKLIFYKLLLVNSLKAIAIFIMQLWLHNEEIFIFYSKDTLEEHFESINDN